MSILTTAAGALQAGAGRATSPELPRTQPVCRYEDLGLLEYARAWELQRQLVEQRKTGAIEDRLLLVEHPPVITLGRNAKKTNLLLPEQRYQEIGIDLQSTDRGGDVTYHGPGQVVGYPILDLREWKRDVVRYVRALEQVMIGAVSEFGIQADGVTGCTGVWVEGAKLGAIGVHISRWVTSHGFALNVAPQMEHFGVIIPCGLHKPVVSMEQLLGQAPAREEVLEALVRHFGQIFGRRMEPAAPSPAG
jgi:lipoyl(octanoyl) transferase